MDEIADGAVGVDEIAPGAVGTTQIADGAVTRSKFQASYTVTVNLGSIANGACLNSGIPAVGVAGGDMLLVAPPANLPQGFISQAVAPGVDTINLRLCNLSGAPVDPDPGDYRFTVIR